MLDETTDLITLPTKADVPALFAKKGGIEEVVKRIEKQALSEVFDYTTDKGRKHAKSVASLVSKSKTLIDDVGKALNEERLAANKLVNTTRNMSKERLDALRDKIKKPALDAEAKEADRVRVHLLAIEALETTDLTSQNTSAELQAQIDMTEAVVIGDAWEEYEADARTAKAVALDKLGADKAIARAREEQEAELDALRAEKTKREDADRVAAEEKAETDRVAQVEKDKAEAVKEAAKEAEQQAIADTEAAKVRHQKELDEAKEREEKAAQTERDRAAKERRETEAAEQRRKADKEHRRKIRSEIVAAIAKMKPANWEEAVDAMIAGEVPHVRVQF